MRGHAKIEENLSVTINCAHLTPDRVLIATGARPKRLDLPGAEHMIVSNDVFARTALPDRLAIIGGANIGCEFAAILSALGVQIALVSHSDRLLGNFGGEAVRVATKTPRDQGVGLHLNASPRRIEVHNGGLSVQLDTGETIETDRVLCATGRAPISTIWDRGRWVSSSVTAERLAPTRILRPRVPVFMP